MTCLISPNLAYETPAVGTPPMTFRTFARIWLSLSERLAGLPINAGSEWDEFNSLIEVNLRAPKVGARSLTMDLPGLTSALSLIRLSRCIVVIGAAKAGVRDHSELQVTGISSERLGDNIDTSITRAEERHVVRNVASPQISCTGAVSGC